MVNWAENEKNAVKEKESRHQGTSEKMNTHKKELMEI